jgi:hypothetical protein
MSNSSVRSCETVTPTEFSQAQLDSGVELDAVSTASSTIAEATVETHLQEIGIGDLQRPPYGPGQPMLIGKMMYSTIQTSRC